MGLPGSWCEDEPVMEYQSEARGLPFLASHMRRTRETRPATHETSERIVNRRR